MNKRFFLSLASLFLTLGLSSQNVVNVRVAEGILAGTDSSGVKIFKGVPFAAPPVGNWFTWLLGYYIMVKTQSKRK